MNPAPGPYQVRRIDTPAGPRWGLTGPGLDGTKTYPWDEFRDKLGQMAELMNFVWRQCEIQMRNKPDGGNSPR